MKNLEVIKKVINTKIEDYKNRLDLNNPEDLGKQIRLIGIQSVIVVSKTEEEIYNYLIDKLVS